MGDLGRDRRDGVMDFAPGDSDGGHWAEVDDDAGVFEAGSVDGGAQGFGVDDGGEDAAEGDLVVVLGEEVAKGVFGNSVESLEVDDEALAVADFHVDAGEVVAGFAEDEMVFGDFAEGFGEVFVVLDVEAGGDLLEFGAGELELAGGEREAAGGLVHGLAEGGDFGGGAFDGVFDLDGFLADALEFFEHGFHANLGLSLGRFWFLGFGEDLVEAFEESAFVGEHFLG